MKSNSFSATSVVIKVAWLLFFTLLVKVPVTAQKSIYGAYSINLPPGWIFDSENSNQEYFTFKYLVENKNTGYLLRLMKNPQTCLNQKDFNQAMVTVFYDLYARQDYVDKFKIKSNYSLLGDPDCHFITFNLHDTNERGFILNAFSNGQRHSIYIFDKLDKKKELRPEAVQFLAELKLVPNTEQEKNLAENSKIEPEKKSVNEQINPTNQDVNKNTIPDKNINTALPGNNSSTTEQFSETQHQSVFFASEREIDLTMKKLKFDNFNFDIDFDFETYTKTQYGGAVSFAMEGMRLIYGEMTPEQEQKFTQEWLPLFQFPYPEAIEYLNKLNPLIMKFTAIREVLTEEMEVYNAGILEAMVSASIEDNQQIQLTMAELEITVATMNTLTNQMAEVVNEITNLGNPPIVGEIAANRKKLHKNALDIISGPSLPFEGEWVNEKGEHLLIKLAYVYPDGKLLLYVFPVTWLKNMEQKGYDVLHDPQLKNDKNLGAMPGTWDFLKVFEPINADQYVALDWSFVRQVNVYTFNESVCSQLIYTPPQSDLIQSGTMKTILEKTEDSFSEIPILPFDDNIETWEDLLKAIPNDDWAKNKYSTYTEWRSKYPGELATAIGGGPGTEQKAMEEYQTKRKKIDEQYTDIESDIKAAQTALEVELSWTSEKISEQEKANRIAKRKEEILYQYEHRYDNLNAEYAYLFTKPATVAQKPEISDELIKYVAALKEWESEKALQKQKKEQIKFHETNIEYFQRNIESLKLTMNQAGTNPESKNNMYRDLLVQENSLQREKDAIFSLETGEYIHTRTEHDAYNMKLSMAQSLQKAEEVHKVKRILERIPQLIEMAPETERQRLNDFFVQNTFSGSEMPLDASHISKVARNIGNQVTGQLEQEAATLDEESALAAAKLEAVEYIKTGADMGMTLLSVAAPVYYAYSAPNAIAQSMRAAKAARVFSMYMGSTGFIEGGLSQAFTQTLGSYNAATMIANAGITGYQKGVLNHLEKHSQNAKEVEINENRAGLTGAAWEAGKESAKFLIQGLSMRLILPQPPAKLGAQFNDVANSQTTNTAQPVKWPTIQQQLQQAHLQSRQAQGRAKVNLFQQSVQKLANASKAGASQPEIQQLRSEMENLYTVVKSDYFAKADINHRARQGDSKITHYYNSCERKYIAQLTATVDRKMTQAGYSKQTYKTFSNSASKGKAGMDLDFGVIEPPRYTVNQQGNKVVNPEHLNWRKNITQKLPDGTVVRRSPQDLQAAGKEALEAAYQEVYGRPSGEAMIEFTSSYHPEAYRDLAWLGKNGSKTALVFETDPAWVQQAADVSLFKVNHLPKDHPNLGYYGLLQEQMRGLTKDFDTKIEPMLKAIPNANQRAVAHLRELKTTMDRFAKNELGPIEADNKIKELTGGNGIMEVAEQLSVAMQGLRNMLK